MKNCLFLILSLFFGLSVAHAQSEEALVSFDSHITVNVDNSIDVIETIRYATGPSERHGIFRTIRPYSSQGRKMTINDISVVDQYGQPYPFTVSESGDVDIKIGDPRVTFGGQNVYVIRYHASKAVAQYESFDELYWNVTGSGWDMPIREAHATIVLPQGSRMSQSSCYRGAQGSTATCTSTIDDQGAVSFSAPEILAPGEGLTVAVGFPKGIVTPYKPSDDFFLRYGQWLIAILVPLASLILSFWYWYTKGRDERGTGVIIPQYDVPDELMPMEVKGIVSEKVDAESISSEIIALATRGYLRITEIDKKYIGLFTSTDYELTKLKEFTDIPNEFDKALLESLFSGHARSPFASLKKLFSRSTFLDDGDRLAIATSVKLSDLKNVFYREIPAITSLAVNGLLQKRYYKNLGRLKQAGAMHILGALVVGGIVAAVVIGGGSVPVAVGILVSALIYAATYYLSPAKTEKGALAKEHLLGLKEYLQIAEKDRLLFHNAPEKKPEVFEKLLPYAMILGVADIWAKEFEGIYTTPPTWYSGQQGAFNAVAFSESMRSFSSYASSSLSSAPGSSGGGSSGGGGGGGGGGGW